MEPPINFAQVKNPWLAPMMVTPTKPPLLPLPPGILSLKCQESLPESPTLLKMIKYCFFSDLCL